MIYFYEIYDSYWYLFISDKDSMEESYDIKREIIYCKVVNNSTDMDVFIPFD